MNKKSDNYYDNMNEQNLSEKGTKSEIGSNRKDYAKIDFGSMGVNLKEHFMSSEKQNLFNYSRSFDLKVNSNRPVVLNHNAKSKAFDNATMKYISGNINSDILNVLKNKKLENCNFGLINDALTEKEHAYKNEKETNCESLEGVEEKDKNSDLPIGWEKHEDNDGPYYWHIKSGTIQREPPVFHKYKYINDEKECNTPMFEYVNNPTIEDHYNNLPVSPTYSRYELRDFENFSMSRSRTIPSLNQEQGKHYREYMRRSYPIKPESNKLVRFTVRSLGWVKIAEEDLVPERSSKAVNKCIIDLSLGRNDLLDVVGRWGDGKNMFMDLEDGSLKLVETETLTVLNSQPIHTIRVWGVGRDNGRDFAYVSRDRLTRIHMCHVFRCDTAARTIANTLRDICKQIMIERSLQLDSNNIGTANNCKNKQESIRPTNLQTENRGFRHSQSFPTPMEEPKKILKALYVGCKEVSQPTGMEIINEAINSVIAQTRTEDWENVNVAIAPSMITVRSSKDYTRLIAECRVRYLSFLGIGKNFKKCAFIVHTARNKFVAHVFHCEPSSGALCKTVEAACKLRYQKCLDAHPENNFSFDSGTHSKGIGAAIKDIIHSLSLKKDKCGLP
ncbi:protein Fe65 homolog [Eupeodes corollae]|uniref:protein Fe65 homolog n=1 Tax=Eupeodes corollae TaxID=290404 RepID=UPI0024915D97|nr:protein Fe65 homolog [Eupeodes corollae]